MCTFGHPQRTPKLTRARVPGSVVRIAQIVFRSTAITVTVPAPGDALFHAWVHMGYAPSNGRWVFTRADLDYAHMPANTGAVGSGLEVTVQVADVQ